MKASFLHNIRAKFVLAICMAAIGSFTLYASANTYEVIAKEDVPFSPVIQTVRLTSMPGLNKELKIASMTKFNEGSFGVPKKIKLSETKQHIDIIPGHFNASGWLASKGLAQTVVTTDQKQKVFGEAVIYLRYNTLTTQHLGEVLNDDIVNVVTTEGWQLGYQVSQTSDDPSRIDRSLEADTSRIIVVMINDTDGSVKSFQASLVKVGERI
ncbi:MAG TPA: hypothetical protein VK497_06040 [Candidatus Saccharimonadales bacterium]|nr:hypothetical protein [Candidatus Saccharimonadales bacterium]